MTRTTSTTTTAAALTVQDAHKLQSTQLHLVHRRLTAVPHQLSSLSCVTSLDLSDNPLKQLQPQCLPAGLKQLVSAGCQLSGSLPLELTRLTRLEQLVAPANSISSASAAFACQALVHVGLAYNKLTSLLQADSCSGHLTTGSSRSTRVGSGSKSRDVLAASQVVSLDLSHNDIADLHSILQQLQQLPKLQALHLRGNPISLLPQYKAAVLHALPQLAYLDGQKLGDSKAPSLPAAAAVSQPNTAALTPTGAPGAAALQAAAPVAPAAAVPHLQIDATHPAGACQPPDLCSASTTSAGTTDRVVLELELDKLQVSEQAAAVFKELTDKATLQLQQQLTQQQQQQQVPNLLPSRPATAAGSPGAAVSSSGSRGATMCGSDGGSSKSGSSSADVSMQLQPVVPLLPITYHLEVSLPDGAGLCSAAIVVQPPLQSPAEGQPATSGTASAAAAASDSKKPKGGKAQEASKAAAAAASKARPGSSMRTSTAKATAAAAAAADAQQAQAAAAAAAAAEAEAAASSLRPGRLLVQMCVPADVATRDWLRSGFTAKLVRTLQQPRPVLLAAPEPLLNIEVIGESTPPPAASASAATTGAGAAVQGAKTGAAEPAGLKQQGSRSPATSTNGSSGSSSTSGAPQAEATSIAASSVTWEQMAQRKELGTATLAAPSLLDASSSNGACFEVAGPVTFMPPAPLMHPVTHIRLSLAQAQEMQGQPTGSCSFRIKLGA